MLEAVYDIKVLKRGNHRPVQHGFGYCQTALPYCDHRLVDDQSQEVVSSAVGVADNPTVGSV